MEIKILFPSESRFVWHQILDCSFQKIILGTAIVILNYAFKIQESSINGTRHIFIYTFAW